MRIPCHSTSNGPQGYRLLPTCQQEQPSYVWSPALALNQDANDIEARHPASVILCYIIAMLMVSPLYPSNPHVNDAPNVSHECLGVRSISIWTHNHTASDYNCAITSLHITVFISRPWKQSPWTLFTNTLPDRNASEALAVHIGQKYRANTCIYWTIRDACEGDGISYHILLSCSQISRRIYHGDTRLSTYISNGQSRRSSGDSDFRSAFDSATIHVVRSPVNHPCFDHCFSGQFRRFCRGDFFGLPQPFSQEFSLYYKYHMYSYSPHFTSSRPPLSPLGMNYYHGPQIR